MILRPPRSKRTDTLCPYTTLFRSRLWHRVLIRIGANTVKTYRQASDPGVRLGENDSYFIDLGLVFDGHEGDVGDTFVVGHAPQRQACAEAARALFGQVADAWRHDGLSGQALYAFAAQPATARGWRFHQAIQEIGRASGRETGCQDGAR